MQHVDEHRGVDPFQWAGGTDAQGGPRRLNRGLESLIMRLISRREVVGAVEMTICASTPSRRHRFIPLEWVDMVKSRRAVDLTSVVSALAGRRVLVGEIIDALGIGASTYYEQRDAGRLARADNVLSIAAHLGLNPAELLMACGLLDAEAIIECADRINDGTAMGLSRRRRFNRRTDYPPL